MKMVNDRKFVFNTDVQAVQALQLTIDDHEAQFQDGWGRSAHSQESQNCRYLY